MSVMYETIVTLAILATMALAVWCIILLAVIDPVRARLDRPSRPALGPSGRRPAGPRVD